MPSVPRIAPDVTLRYSEGSNLERKSPLMRASSEFTL